MSIIIDPKDDARIDPNTKKIAPEDLFRKKILARARYIGVETEVRQIFDKYDLLLKNCTNQQEREAIGVLGVTELSKYLDCTSLTVNGKVIVDDSDEEKLRNKR